MNEHGKYFKDSYQPQCKMLHFFFQVSWIRRRDYHLLTVSLTTYSSDERYSVSHAKHSEVIFNSISYNISFVTLTFTENIYSLFYIFQQKMLT